MKTYLVLGLVSFLALTGCEIFEKQNLPPEPFDVIVSASTSNSVKIEWTPSYDPDNDSIFYSVILNNEVKASRLVNVYSLEIKNLEPETHYSGTVTASDSRANSHIEPFSFSTKINSSPEPFEVVVSKVSYDLAVVEWEKAFDIDNDSVTYSVLLNGKEIASQLKSLFKYELRDLLPETNYLGCIRATDTNNNIRDIPFSFSTTKYFLMFSKLWKFIDDYRITPMNAEPTADGGYIMELEGYIPDQNYWMAVKLDSQANIEWKTTSAMDPARIDDHIIRQTSDLGYLVLCDKTMIKLNNHGEIQWEYSPAGDLVHDRTIMRSYIQTSDNGFLVVGHYVSDAPGIILQGILIKINENGIKEWHRFLGTSYRTYCYDIEKSSEGSYMIAATTGNDDYQELFIEKIDEAGNTILTKAYSTSGYSFVRGITKTRDNGLIVGGITVDSRSRTVTRIIKINDDGDLIWEEFFDWSPFQTSLTGITTTDNNDYVFTGIVQISDYIHNCYLARLSSNGNLLWKRFYPHSELVGGCGTSGKTVRSTDDGGFIILGGRGCIWLDDVPDSGVWLFKTDPDGNYEY
jgi:ribosomal protein S16